MTFSIVARCSRTGMFGVAVSSSSPAVAARCAYARAKVGAASSQNITDPALGAAVLRGMEEGLGAGQAIGAAVKSTLHRDHRQLTAVDGRGESFVYTGSRALGRSSGFNAENVACAGNLLANENIPRSMVEAFQSTEGHFVDRIIEAMRAALRSGGEEGPVHSAGLKVVRDVPWPIVDLRIDWTEDSPVEELASLWKIFAPQVEDYVTRALNPDAAPNYGVPGDD